MQALKTVAGSGCHEFTCEPVARLEGATAFVCGKDVLYAARDGALASFDVTTSLEGAEGAPAGGHGQLLLRPRPQEFAEPLASTAALALLGGGTLLVARGATRSNEPTVSAALAFWMLRDGARSIERVRETPLTPPNNAAVAAWATHEDGASGAYIVAVAYNDIHCTVSVLTFRKGDLRPHKPSVHTVPVARDANGAFSVTNIHLVAPPEPPRGAPRLFVTLVARDNRGGRIESWSLERGAPAGVTALGAAAVARGASTEYGDNEVLVVTAPDAEDGASPGYSSQLETFLADCRVACLPYALPVSPPLARMDDRTIALPVQTRRGDAAVAVADLKNRLELACHPLRSDLLALVPLRSQRAALLLHADASATLLSPKPLAEQVALITRRKHYKEAIGVAEDAVARLEAAHAPAADAAAARELVAATEAKFASHLLERAGEPEAAMQHYVKTIGYLSVSTVIQKFLDTAHMRLLRTYLEAVAANAAVMRPAYAAVLLSLYVQLRDAAALRAFIEGSIDPAAGGYKWDVDDAIATCLDGGYHEEALLIAKASGRHAKAVGICLYHSGRSAPRDGSGAGAGAGAGASAALDYVRSAPRDVQAELLRRHGRTLISRFQLEMQVTPIVHSLCSPAAAEGTGSEGGARVWPVSDFVPIYADAPGALRVLCDALLQEWLSGPVAAAHAGGGDPSGAAAATARSVFHLLLDLLLDPAHHQGADGLREDERERQALAAMQRGWPAGAAEGAAFDADAALRLCQLHGFKAGLLFLFERMQDHVRLQQVLIEHRDWPALVDAAVAHPGERGEHLAAALEALVAAADEEGPSGGAPAAIARALRALAPPDAPPGTSEAPLTPLAVLAILQRSATLTFDVAREYVLGHLRAQQERARYSAERIEEQRVEAARLAAEVEDKRSKPLWVRADDAAYGRLGPAAVFFFCGHAYPEDACERRPDDGALICARCATDPAKQAARRAAAAEPVDRARVNEAFFTEIRSRGSAAAFDVIGHHLARAGALI